MLGPRGGAQRGGREVQQAFHTFSVLLIFFLRNFYFILLEMRWGGARLRLGLGLEFRLGLGLRLRVNLVVGIVSLGLGILWD